MAIAVVVAMVISRCAWHPFFCGYPRPLRVVSWRGARIAFADTICRSCAARVRIEGLWAPSPPPPVWPGSAHTALLFIGLPVLIALVLMATPLHDATRLAPRHDARVVANRAWLEAPVPAQPVRRRAASAASRPDQGERVPDVIFETRSSVRRGPHDPRGRASEPRRARVVPAATVESNPAARHVQSP